MRRRQRGREKKCVVVCVVVVTVCVVVVVVAVEYTGCPWPYGGGGVCGRTVSVDLVDLEGEPLLPRWNKPTISPTVCWGTDG